MDKKLRNRYSRQTMFPQIGEVGQGKLIRSTVAVVGCGAIGGHAAELLVRAGVGKVKIIDRDFVEEHNLQRQVMFTEANAFSNDLKAKAAKEYLERVNPYVEVIGIVADLNQTNAEKYLRGTDVIIDGTDNWDTRFLLNDTAHKLNIPWIYGSALGSGGMTKFILPGKSACLRCWLREPPKKGSYETCETAGVLNTIPAIIASYQVTQAIQYLVGTSPIVDDLVVLDPWHGTYHSGPILQEPSCPTCHGKYEYLEAPQSIKTTSLCGQGRAIQVVDPEVTKADPSILSRDDIFITINDTYKLVFMPDDYPDIRVVVFPDGRAIVKGTLDEDLAKNLYKKYLKASQ